jgi:hypothetical protein
MLTVGSLFAGIGDRAGQKCEGMLIIEHDKAAEAAERRD